MAPMAMPTMAPVLRCKLELLWPPLEPEWPPLELDGPLEYIVVTLPPDSVVMLPPDSVVTPPPDRVEMELTLEDSGVGEAKSPEFEVGMFVPDPTVDEEEALGLWPA